MTNRTGKRERQARNRKGRWVTTVYAGSERISVKAGRKKRRRIYSVALGRFFRPIAAAPVDDSRKSEEMTQGECAAGQAGNQSSPHDLEREDV